jgi:hypothetical protein
VGSPSENLERVHVDRTSGAVLAVDAAAVIHWDGFDFTGTTAHRASFHYPDRSLVAIPDIAAFVRGVTQIDERAMQWTAGDAQSLYREAVRFGDRVLIAWGRNNARDLQTIGITATEANAKALVASFRTHPPKGFKPTSPYFVEGRGGVSREYHPPTEDGGREIRKGVARCIDNIVEWATMLPDHERDTLREEHASDEAAQRRFDELELSWYQRGGRPSEIEWMKQLQRRADHTLLAWFERQRGESTDPVALARGLLEAAGIAVPELPATPHELHAAFMATPAAHWVRVGERAGKVARQAAAKANTEVWLDASLFAVATITKDKRGAVAKVKVKRLKSADLARAHFAAEVAK